MLLGIYSFCVELQLKLAFNYHAGCLQLQPKPYINVRLKTTRDFYQARLPQVILFSLNHLISQGLARRKIGTRTEKNTHICIYVCVCVCLSSRLRTQYNNMRIIFQVLVLMASATAAVLARFSQTAIVAIIVSTASAVESFNQFEQTPSKLRRYNATVRDLTAYALLTQCLCLFV